MNNNDRMKAEASSMAMEMFTEMLTEIVPDEDKVIFEVPKTYTKLSKAGGRILKIIGDIKGIPASREAAKIANLQMERALDILNRCADYLESHDFSVYNRREEMRDIEARR